MRTEETPHAHPYLTRLPRRSLPPYGTALPPLLSLFSALLLGFAAPGLIGAETPADYIKCALIAVSGGVVSYGVIRLAVDRGAPQAAIGSMAAMLASIVSVLSVGIGLWAATYGGLSVRETDRLLLEAHGTAQADVIAARMSALRKDARTGPALQALTDELARMAACEAASSCFSGHGTGGRGEVFRSLHSAHSRAVSVLEQVGAGEARIGEEVARLTMLQERYASLIADEALSPAEQRREAQNVHSRMAQHLSALNEAVPAALVRAFAQELANGMSANGGDDVRLRRYFSSQAAQLEAASGEGTKVLPELPALPARAGISDTLVQIPHFLPVALIIAVVELIFPTCIWLYSYIALATQVRRAETGSPPPSAGPNAAPRPSRRAE